MKELMKDVDMIVEEEHERANEIFPPFASRHEGIGVIFEEMAETSEEYTRLRKMIRELEEAVYKDGASGDLIVTANQISLAASMLACEAVQVAAMGRKFIEMLRAEEVDTPDDVREQLIADIIKEIEKIPDDEIMKSEVVHIRGKLKKVQGR